MFRWLIGVVWLALGAIVAVWFCEGLFATDHRESIIALISDDRETDVIVVGVLWGLVSIALAGALNAKRGRS